MPSTNEISRFRTDISRSASPRVHEKGGKFNHGYISDVSLITRGEALGHDLWIDSAFLDELTGACNAELGVKARFTHPGLCSDGVGTKLGRFFNIRRQGDQVIGDLHFQEASTITPDGDLRAYVMSLAAETPEDFGLSIVFEHSMEDADAFMDLYRGSDGSFESPDEDNIYQLPHCRLLAIHSCDVVDTPAANPNGLFQRGQQNARVAYELLEFAFGLSAKRPEELSFGGTSIDGERAKAFVSHFLASHNLSVRKETGVTEIVNEGSDPQPSSRETFVAEFQKYVEAFGLERGTEYCLAGKDFVECQIAELDHVRSELSAANDQIKELQAKLAAVQLGESEGPAFAAAENSGKTERRSRIRIAGKNYED